MSQSWIVAALGASLRIGKILSPGVGPYWTSIGTHHLGGFGHLRSRSCQAAQAPPLDDCLLKCGLSPQQVHSRKLTWTLTSWPPGRVFSSPDQWFSGSMASSSRVQASDESHDAVVNCVHLVVFHDVPRTHQA